MCEPAPGLRICFIIRRGTRIAETTINWIQRRIITECLDSRTTYSAGVAPIVQKRVEIVKSPMLEEDGDLDLVFRWPN